jgi:transposase
VCVVAGVTDMRRSFNGLAVAKYVEHMPLYRQQQALKRQGVELSRSTLCD